jgi:hypothetical protein
VRRADISGRQVIVSPHSFYDAENGMSLPLALNLKAALVRGLTKNNVTVLSPGPDQLEYSRIRGSWIKEKSELFIHLEVIKFGEGGAEVTAAVSSRVPLSEIDPKALEADRESWGRYLIRRLEANCSGAKSISIHVRPIKVPPEKADPDLGPYLGEWLYSALTESSVLRPLDQQSEMRGVPIKELRTRGIAPKAKVEKEQPSLTADLIRADGELRGEAWLHTDKGIMEMRLRVVDRSGRQVTAAAGDIPVALFPSELMQPPRASATPPREGISKKGLFAEISTTKGEGRPVYHKGERIAFFIRLNRPSYFYLFNLDSSGTATLLYPVDSDGRPAGSGKCGSLLEPNKLLVIPEDGCSVDLVVQEPFGKDTVWGVATEAPLGLPESFTGEWSRSELVVERIRSRGLSGQSGYAECELQVITR